MYGSRMGGGGFGQRRQDRFVPVKVGDELDVKIEAVGEKGDGIAKKDGFVLFVPGVKQGDQVKVRVTKVLRKVGFAEVVGAGASSESEQPQSEESEETAESEGEVEEAPIEEPLPGEEAEDTENFGEESEESQEE